MVGFWNQTWALFRKNLIYHVSVLELYPFACVIQFQMWILILLILHLLTLNLVYVCKRDNTFLIHRILLLIVEAELRC